MSSPSPESRINRRLNLTQPPALAERFENLLRIVPDSIVTDLRAHKASTMHVRVAERTVALALELLEGARAPVVDCATLREVGKLGIKIALQMAKAVGKQKGYALLDSCSVLMNESWCLLRSGSRPLTQLRVFELQDRAEMIDHMTRAQVPELALRESARRYLYAKSWVPKSADDALNQLSQLSKNQLQILPGEPPAGCALHLKDCTDAHLRHALIGAYALYRSGYSGLAREVLANSNFSAIYDSAPPEDRVALHVMRAELVGSSDQPNATASAINFFRQAWKQAHALADPEIKIKVGLLFVSALIGRISTEEPDSAHAKEAGAVLNSCREESEKIDRTRAPRFLKIIEDAQLQLLGSLGESLQVQRVVRARLQSPDLDSFNRREELSLVLARMYWARQPGRSARILHSLADEAHTFARKLPLETVMVLRRALIQSGRLDHAIELGRETIESAAADPCRSSESANLYSLIGATWGVAECVRKGFAISRSALHRLDDVFRTIAVHLSEQLDRGSAGEFPSLPQLLDPNKVHRSSFARLACVDYARALIADAGNDQAAFRADIQSAGRLLDGTPDSPVGSFMAAKMWHAWANQIWSAAAVDGAPTVLVGEAVRRYTCAQASYGSFRFPDYESEIDVLKRLLKLIPNCKEAATGTSICRIPSGRANNRVAARLAQLISETDCGDAAI